jgi:Zn-dependent protease
MIDLSNPGEALASLAAKLPALLVAVTVHEVAHAVVADRLGDPTPRLAGRITLNPLPHIDPLGAIAFVVAGFGWARPVPVSAQYFRHPGRDMALVAGAGPASNFVMAFVALVVLVMARRTFGPGGAGDLVLLFVFQFNLALGIFNLIPLPPLDGGHFLSVWFRDRPWVATLEQYGSIVLLVLVVTGATRYIVGPIFDALTRLYVALLRALV